MNITYLGHACFQVDISERKLLFDPFITPNELAHDIDIDAVQADYVLISHGHADHLADAESILKRTGAKLISNYQIVTWFGKKGIRNAHGMNHGGGYDFDFGRVTYVNAVHSSMLPDGSYGGHPGGFVIESKGGNFYVSGDTALTYDMKLIGESKKLDWAALCIGDNFTMGAKDAARAAEFVGVRKALALHYDTFPQIKIDHDAAQKEFEDKGIELRLARIGEAFAW